jgi:DNA topoisomerase-1
LLIFGDSLPVLRRRVRRDLAAPGLSCNKVLALLASLLDETLICIGNDEYAYANHRYGLTTLLTRHVRNERDRLRFLFKVKSGQTQDLELDDARLIRIVRRIQHLPGQRLF